MVSPVKGMVDDDLAAREELDMRAADAEIRDLFVFEPVLGGNDVERLAHRCTSRRLERRTEGPLTTRREASSDSCAVKERSDRRLRVADGKGGKGQESRLGLV